MSLPLKVVDKLVEFILGATAECLNVEQHEADVLGVSRSRDRTVGHEMDLSFNCKRSCYRSFREDPK